MKKNILSTSNWIYGILISLIGFSFGCSKFGKKADMYGSPSANFIISGKVTDKQNNPINGIEINLIEKTDNKSYTLQTTKSGDNGEFHIIHTDSPREITYTVSYHDADGEANGGDFEDMSQNIEFKNEDYTGGSGMWYKGEAKKTANAVLTLKDNGIK